MREAFRTTANKMDQNTNGATTSPLQGYLQTVENLNSLSFGNEEDRLRALHATYALVSRIESPWETVVRLGMGQVRRGFYLGFKFPYISGSE